MNTTEIKHVLQYNVITQNSFSGVYAIDKLKNIKKKPKLIICNTDKSYNAGKHWILFYFYDKCVDFYDPLGNEPTYYGTDFIDFMKRFALKFNICYNRTQPINSNLCGHYCVWYANLRCQHYNMYDILNNLPNSDTIKKFTEYYLENVKYCYTGQKCIQL